MPDPAKRDRLSAGSPPFQFLMFPIHLALLLQDLTMTVRQTFSRWLGSSGVAAVAMQQIVAHALLRRRVARRSIIEGTQWRWQDLEADGLFLLREEGRHHSLCPKHSSSRFSKSFNWVLLLIHDLSRDTRHLHGMPFHFHRSYSQLCSAHFAAASCWQLWLQAMIKFLIP